MLGNDFVLKSGELYLVGDISTDGSRDRATGLYARDTRHLNRFRITINGLEPEILSAFPHNATHGAVVSANTHFRSTNNEVVLAQQVLLEHTIKLDDCLRVTFALQNFHRSTVDLSLQFEIAADFRDLFDIRGFPRTARGAWQLPHIDAREITFGYKGLDGLLSATRVVFDREPEFVRRLVATDLNEGMEPILPGTEELPFEHERRKLPEVVAKFDLTLQTQERWVLSVEVIPQPASGPPIVGTVPRESTPAIVHSDNRAFNKLMLRCRQDLEALQTSFPDGALPAAGIPWFVAPFGRDSLITGLQTLPLYPERSIGILRVLAALQGVETDAEREEEPGKILHEMRYGEMARMREVPHSPYYGSVDATPLWLWLFAETVAWTGDEDLFRELLPNARRAVEWIQHYGDLDGDGLVEYRGCAHEHGHITNQVWKDSYDSLNHLDGGPVTGPVAPVEVQGYIFAAYQRMADVCSVFSEGEWAAELRQRAEQIRRLVEDRFWLPALEFYAQALDGEKKPVAVLSSNPGHLLMCELPSRDRAQQLMQRMLQADLDSGRGIRTLSSEAVTYNPMSYHNGSIWPHDNSIIGAGFYRYREWEAGHAITTALFDVAQEQDLFRLPELYCGFGRYGSFEHAPVPYPVGCSPQAWAAGAMPLLVCSMLGLLVDLKNRRLTLSPSLPKWLDELTISDITVLGARGCLTVRRAGSGFSVESAGLPIHA